VNPTIEAPVFSGVEVDATDNSFDNGMGGDARVRFVGTYKATTFTDENKTGVLVMGGGNMLYYVTAGAGQGAQRAYFLIGDNAVLAPQLTSFNINFGGETTGIRLIDNGQLIIDNSWYTIDGRKLDGKPSTKGLYINNGRKVVIK
jgi:ethanolamine utilization protein EutA (predicted chaperonin)